MKAIILLPIIFLISFSQLHGQSVTDQERVEIDSFDTYLKKHLRARNHEDYILIMDQLRQEKGDESYYNSMLIDLNSAKADYALVDPKPPFFDFLDSLSNEKVTMMELAQQEGAKDVKNAYLNVQDVPNQKLINNSYVSDPNGKIESASINSINRICKEIEDSVGAQIAVVVLNSIGSGNPHDFGVELFNYWGIGRQGYDDGLLIFLVMDQRRVEFITGYGMERVIPDALAYEIQQNEMVPHFKNGDYDTGLINGVRASADVILGGPAPEYSGEEYTPDPRKNKGLEMLKWYGKYIVLPFSLLYVLFLLIALLIKNRYKRYRWMQLFTLLIFPIAIPVPFVLIYFLNKRMMERWRNTIRISFKTGLPMVVLSEQGDDKFLSKGQQVEERIKSVDYDVWRGENDEDLLILRYTKWFSKYSKCPKCRYKTYYLVYNRTITPATYSSSGTGEKKHSCKNCGHSRVRTYTIPKLQKSSSSSSSGGYSSSSSGGSWGGGSSGGGGAGSSW